MEKFFSVKARDVESLAELTEDLYIELSSFRQGGIQFYDHGTSEVVEAQSRVHKLFWSQLGVSLLFNEVSLT